MSELTPKAEHLLDPSDCIIGVKCVKKGGKSGTWENVNKDGYSVDVPGDYFEKHPTYAGIQDVIIENEYMVKIPKFYFKNSEHKQILLSPTKVDDSFKCHPAFMKDGLEQDCFYIAKYLASESRDGKLESRPNKGVLIQCDWNKVHEYTEKMCEKSDYNWCMPTLYMLSAIQILFMIEYATTDSQSTLGLGNKDQNRRSLLTNDPANMQSSYRGITCLWGNLWQWVDGAKCKDGVFYISDNLGKGNLIKTDILIPQVGPNNSTWYAGRNCGWIQTMNTTSGDNYDMKDVFIPVAYSGNDADGTYSDYFFGCDKGETRLAVGGDYSTRDNCGLFCMRMDTEPEYVGRDYGFRLAIL